MELEVSDDCGVVCYQTRLVLLWNISLLSADYVLPFFACKKMASHFMRSRENKKQKVFKKKLERACVYDTVVFTFNLL